MDAQLVAVLVGIITGTLARLFLLRVDYRHYPSYPQGYIIHLSLGFVAAAIGAVATPALLAKDYAAASFLALAATQFREVRKIERETLEKMESTELVVRGTGYIEGIARVFEARNYLAMLTALIAGLAATATARAGIGWQVVIGVATAAPLVAILDKAMVGPRIKDIAEVTPADIGFQGPLLTVEGVVIMNIGRAESRKIYQEHGLAVVVRPKDPAAKATLSNLGQRQAIVHDAASILGVRMDADEHEFSPLARRNTATGDVVLTIIPQERNIEALIEAVRRVPVLEGSVRKPLASPAGRMAD